MDCKSTSAFGSQLATEKALRNRRRVAGAGGVSPKHRLVGLQEPSGMLSLFGSSGRGRGANKSKKKKPGIVFTPGNPGKPLFYQENIRKFTVLPAFFLFLFL